MEAQLVAAVVLAVAMLAAIGYALPATRPAVLALARPLSWVVIGAGVLLAFLVLLTRRPPRRTKEPPPAPPPPPVAPYLAGVAADRADAVERETTRAAVNVAETTGDAAPLLDRERELRERLGLPPI